MIEQFWNECRTQLLSLRSSINKSTPPADQAAAVAAMAQRIESIARQLDPNRRTSMYNLPSVSQDQMNAIMSKTVYLANKWVADGCPVVPAI